MSIIKKYLLFLLGSVLFLPSCNPDKETWMIPDANISNFIFKKELNNLTEDIVGEIDHKYRTITLYTSIWIPELSKMIATIEGKGNCYVNNVLQESNYSKVDFTNREILYRIQGNGEEDVIYRVILKSGQTTGLPCMKIDIEGGKEILEKQKEYYKAEFCLKDYKNTENELTSITGIRGRGNTSWYAPKKPYRIKFDKRTSLFGYPAAKSWVLLANYIDPTLLMNSVAFKLGQNLELEHTNHGHHVELYINGTHRGNYLLTEQVQSDKNRVNINEKNGGFLLELDEYFDEDYKFRSNVFNLPVMLKDPETDETLANVIEYFNSFEKELTKDFSKSKYEDYLDVNSLINFMIVNELTNNRELYYPKSTYLYRKDGGQKMKFGPLWDFDWGFGKDTKNKFDYFEMQKNLFYPPSILDETGGKAFFCNFLNDPIFRNTYKERWNQLSKTGALNLEDYFDEEMSKLKYSQELNFLLWPNQKNFSEQVEAMKKWYFQHVEMLDEEINSWN